MLLIELMMVLRFDEMGVLEVSIIRGVMFRRVNTIS